MNNAAFMSRNYEPLAFELQLPWEVDTQKEQKFRRLLGIAIALFFLLFVVMQFLTVTLDENEAPENITTTLILEPKKEPKPPEPEPIARATPKPVPPPKPVKKVATVKKKVPTAAKKPKKPVSVAASHGLDDLSSQLAALTGAVNTQKLRKKNVTRSDRGKVSEATAEHIGESQVTQRSAGVVVDDDIMKANVAALSNRQAVEVEGLNLGDGLPSTSNNFGQLRAGMRDMESIRRSLEATKSRVYAIYQRKLIEQPDLAGKFIFNLIIEPSGKVSRLSLISSELGLNELEDEILGHIRKVHFGQDDVVATTVDYTFYFTPT